MLACNTLPKNVEWFYYMREKILNGNITRNTLKSFKNVRNKREILLYRYAKDDLSLFFKAYTLNLNVVINFGIEECDINLQKIKQSFIEIEKNLYECKRCNMIQCDIDKMIDEEKFSPLMFAIWINRYNIKIIKNLLTQVNIDNQTSYPSGITLLQLACSMNNLEIVKILLNNNAKVDNKTIIYTLLGGKSGWKLCLNFKEKNYIDDDDDENVKYNICKLLLLQQNEKLVFAIDIAKRLNYHSIVELLIKGGESQGDVFSHSSWCHS